MNQAADESPRETLWKWAPQLVLFGNTALIWARAERDPKGFQALMQEDGWAEWGTFLAFAIAAVVAFAAFRRGKDRLDKLALAGLALFCFFVAGEEISWGQRLLAFKPPEVFLKHNFQQEANLHNVFKAYLNTRWMVAAIALIYGALFFLKRVKRVDLSSFAPPLELIPWLLVVAYLEIFYPFELTGEWAELTLGLVLLVDASQRRFGRSEAGRPAGFLLLLSLFGAVLLVPFFERIVYGEQTQAVAQTEIELQSLKHDLEQPEVLRPKLFRKRRVHKRLYTAVSNGYIRFGTSSEFLGGRVSIGERDSPEARRDRRGYFLDQWNQPYWFESRRRPKGHRVRVYSFGPNRKRDYGGDDIVAEIDLDARLRSQTGSVSAPLNKTTAP